MDVMYIVFDRTYDFLLAYIYVDAIIALPYSINTHPYTRILNSA